MSHIDREKATCEFLQNENYLFPNNDYCDVEFDKSFCWYNVTRGDTLFRQCPFNFCLSIEGCAEVAASLQVQRTCHLNGTWGAPDYGGCLEILHNYKQCFAGFCNSCPDPLRQTVMVVTMCLSVTSVAVLVAALVLFTFFDSLQCRRLSIHKNLATAFVFRFAVLALWNAASTSHWFYDCAEFNQRPLYHIEWMCKCILWFFIYFQVASVMWMFIEGAYLYSRFTVFAMRSAEPPSWVFQLVGWGVPFVVVMVWTVVHEEYSRLNANSFCWLPYAQGPHLWILTGTMEFALILNLLFLFLIVVILVQKLHSGNTDTKIIWKTVKATFLLVPLLGVSNFPLFYEPDHPSGAYMLISAILQHSQGIFIAVLYCFLNSEVQLAVKRQIAKLPYRFLFRRHTYFETQRTYVPESGTVNTRHGIPMEQLEGNSDSQSQRSTTGEPLAN
ncbi:hypothetical protein QR680_001839 [Steinernema hermaphroditum]|uniref:G-protein coupled receptors family 2 profile 2 domain-containing protein n=1 Tax=Steinernema hermaphroditum TaxID=289476 RepID=A0AA39LH06_9BILA|nr:hypothetical protein QR680_001839 [Steinernema hermaphroditum]